MQHALDWSGLTDFARHVAQVNISIPPSERLAMATTTVARPGWFRSRDITREEQVSRRLKGWILLIDPTEGWVQCRSQARAQPSVVEGFEEGQLLMLARSGHLMRAKYDIHLWNPVDGPSREWHAITGCEVATADHVVNFDCLNRLKYRQVGKGRTGGRESASTAAVAWRTELGHRRQVKVPQDGMETRRALQQFEKDGSYLPKLQINY